MRASCSGAAVGTLASSRGPGVGEADDGHQQHQPGARDEQHRRIAPLAPRHHGEHRGADEQPGEDHDVGNPDDQVARAGRPLLALPLFRHEHVRPRRNDLVAGDPDVDARFALRQRRDGRVDEGERPVGARLQLRGTRRHFPDLSACRVEAEPFGDGLDGERPRGALRRATRRRDLPARCGGRAAPGRPPRPARPIPRPDRRRRLRTSRRGPPSRARAGTCRPAHAAALRRPSPRRIRAGRRCRRAAAASRATSDRASRRARPARAAPPPRRPDAWPTIASVFDLRLAADDRHQRDRPDRQPCHAGAWSDGRLRRFEDDGIAFDA